MKNVVIAALAAMLLAAPATAQTAKPANPDTGFVAQQANDRLASRLIGLNIQNPANETIGEIHDIVLTDANAVRAYYRERRWFSWDRHEARSYRSQGGHVQPTG